MKGRVLVCAGSDSSGGAGIQADIKTIMALGGYAMTAITAVTAQDTLSVGAIVPMPAKFVRRQMAMALDDLGADAIKTGMLFNAEIIEAVADELDGRPRLPLVLDPVMVSTSGTTLLGHEAVAALEARLFPLTTLLTPNAPEAGQLLGRTIDDLAAMEKAAVELRGMGPANVLLKGGHVPGFQVHDVLATADGVTVLSSNRIETAHTHGTGCTLASAIAAGLAVGLDLPAAVDRARVYLAAAIRTAPGLGRGHGPLNHAVRLAN